MYNRLLSSKIRTSSKSILLLGPRQVGKSTLIHSLKPELEINLAQESEYFQFQTELSELENRLAASNAKTIFIDEIQRIPRLTNTVQYLIDKNPKLKFYLTGSSARKLKRGKANLLPGRLFSFQLTPLCISELESDWDENTALQFGTLPGVINLKSTAEKKLLLKSYSSHYLKEEIQAEALVRSIDGFARFFAEVAKDSGQFLDLSKLAKKAKIPRQSTVRHFEILEDTLIVQRVSNDPNIDSESADLIKHPRFFFFDVGVLNALRGSFDLSADRIGNIFEHLVFNQIFNSAVAHQKDLSIHNFRTRGGLEVDFILRLEKKVFAIECKATAHISSNDISSLKQLSRYYNKIQSILIYRGTRELKENGVWILPLKKALDVLGLD